MNVDLRHGDCVELMRAMPECSVDSIVTDPPYGLEFMGKDWDAPWKAGEVVTVTDEATNGTFHTKGFKHGVRYSRGRQEMLAFQEWFETVAVEALRVLKPGGHLLAFGGTRTYHRMVCAIEDAGFEIRDSIHWVYGSGFPKSLNVGKAIDKRRDDREDVLRVTGEIARLRDAAGLTNRDLDGMFGFAGMAGHWTSTKSQPAVPTPEQWTVLRETLEPPQWLDDEVWRLNGRKGAPGEAWGQREVVGTKMSGIANRNEGPRHTIGASKAVEVDVTAPATDEARRWEGWGTALKPAHEPIVVARKPLVGTVAANVLAWGTGGLNIDGCRVGTTDRFGGGSNGTSGFASGYESGDGWQPGSPHGRWPANIVLDGAAAAALDQQSGVTGTTSRKVGKVTGTTFGSNTPMPDDLNGVLSYGDKGGASRYFTQADWGPDDWPFVYQAKPSRRERNAGLDGMPLVKAGSMSGGETRPDRPTNHPMRQNHHPTVKPVALMRHLVRLVTPPGGTVLDPFAGSGTTLVAAVLEGFDAIGCEMTDEYLPIIRGRVAWAQEQAQSVAEAAANPEQPTLL